MPATNAYFHAQRLHSTATPERSRSSAQHEADACRTSAQHGGLDFDDVGNTWPARDVEHGAALEDIDPRGFVS